MDEIHEEKTGLSRVYNSEIATSHLPEPEKYAKAIKTIPYSSGLTTDANFDRPQFATSVKPGKIEIAPRDLTRKDYPHPENPNAEKRGTGDSIQPFLKPSLSKKQLAERFPDDFTTSDTGESQYKPGMKWNPRGRQFLNIVSASDATKNLQSKADTDNYPKGRESQPSDPAKSTRSHK